MSRCFQWMIRTCRRNVSARAVAGLLRCLAMMTAVFSGTVLAAIDVYDFPDAATESRFRELTHELRCPKCQNQNINDSGAPLARDIKDRVHTLLIQGKSNDEITDYMIERYGDFVTYRPRLSVGTLLLWTLPAAAAILAFVALVWAARARQASGAAAPGDRHSADTADIQTGAGTPTTDNAAERERIEHLLRKYSDTGGRAP
jgi:cytochrome c-type biogenesis protein CcmH